MAQATHLAASACRRPGPRDGAPGSAASSGRAPPRSGLALFFDLFKLRIGLVIAVTALVGFAAAPGGSLASGGVVLLFLGVTLSAAAAGAFNQFHEHAIDARMTRTRHRAFVTGRLQHRRAWFALIGGIAVTGVALVGIASNATAALYSALGALTYGFVYTVWLKPRTAWNIVVGGLAGSFAILTGAAAAGGADLAPVTLAFALLLFLWTPPHFWSLAIAYRDDYVSAGIPMLPVLIGNVRAARVVLASAVCMVLVSVTPALFGMGIVYLLGASVGGTAFVATSVRLARDPTRHNAMANFHMSLVQLSVLLMAAFLDVTWHVSP